MTNQLVPTTGMLPGLADDRAVRDMVDNFHSRIESDRGYDELPRLPTTHERADMEARRLELVRKVRPVRESIADGDNVMQALGQLWLRYPSLRNADVGAMSAAYYADLESLPLFAILAAFNDVVKGRITGLDPDWPPTSPRIYDVAVDHVSAPWRELERTKRVLAVSKVTPPSMPPERQQELRQSVEEWLRERKMTREENAAQERADAAKKLAPSEKWILREYAALGIEPVLTSGGAPVSVSLARQLGMLR